MKKFIFALLIPILCFPLIAVMGGGTGGKGDFQPQQMPVHEMDDEMLDDLIASKDQTIAYLATAVGALGGVVIPLLFFLWRKSENDRDMIKYEFYTFALRSDNLGATSLKNGGPHVPSD